MSQTIEDLIMQLAADDPSARGSAQETLIQHGEEAAPALRVALTHANPQVRALAAEALGQIGDAASPNALADLLLDADGTVRSAAAVALARFQDPRAVDALLRTLNDDPDVRHSQFSRSAYALIGLGPDVLPKIYPLLKAADQETRTRAFWIVNQVVTQLPGADGDWQPVSQALQAFDPRAEGGARAAAAEELTSAVQSYVGGTGDG